AFTKTFAIFFAAILAITLGPAIQILFTRVKNFSIKPDWLNKAANSVLVGKIHSEEEHPISRILFRIYDPVVRFVLKRPKQIIISAIVVLAVSLPFFFTLGKEFMPPLNEGMILYMPTTPPGISVTEATKLLQAQDILIKSIPEVG